MPKMVYTPESIWRRWGYVVGVDPGYGCTGLAVVGPAGIVFARGYKGDYGKSLEERTGWLVNNVVCRAFAVTGPGKNRVLFGLEDNHFSGGKSAQTALQQRELIGALACMANTYGFEVRRVAAAQAKKALTGSGGSDKDDMVAAACEHPDFPVGMPKYEAQAVADAYAVALACIGVESDNTEWAL